MPRTDESAHLSAAKNRVSVSTTSARVSPESGQLAVNYLKWDIISLYTWSKQKWLFWRAGFHSTNQSNLESI